MDRKRFDYLVSAHFDDEMTPEEQTDLEAMLLGDERAPGLFWQHAQDENSLRAAGQRVVVADNALTSSDKGSIEERRSSAIVTPRSKSFLDRASKRPVRPALAVAVLAMISVLSWMAVTYLPERVAGSGGKNAESEQPAAQPEFVAWLMGMHKTLWLDNTEPQHTRLKPGQRLAIEKGIIEIQYVTGAVVVIEGPAEFVVGNDEHGVLKEKTEGQNIPHSSLSTQYFNSGYLAHGKLVARIEGKEAQGFFVDTPSTRVEDLGTEFGLTVNKVGDTKIAVYVGAVIVDPEDSVTSAYTVKANEAVFVSAKGSIASASFHDFQLTRRYPSRDSLGITSVEGRIRMLRTPPRSVEFGAIESSDEILMFPEQRSVTLSQDVPVSIDKPGAYRQFAPNAAVVPSGTRVDSYYFSFDPADAPTRQVRLSGSVTFDRPVLGVICLEAPLRNTNSQFGPTTTKYPAKWHPVDKNDRIILSRDRRTLQLRWTAGQGAGDQMRVLVESQPAMVIEQSNNSFRNSKKKRQ